tara:strand:+ start:314 stop:694 length:381 start_codon:yes stop_codon:yes gene_type:complete
MDYKKKYLKYKLKYLTAKKLYGGSSEINLDNFKDIFMKRTGVNVDKAISDLYDRGYDPKNLKSLGYNKNLANKIIDIIVMDEDYKNINWQIYIDTQLADLTVWDPKKPDERFPYDMYRVFEEESKI